jgi:MFS family permease
MTKTVKDKEHSTRLAVLIVAMASSFSNAFSSTSLTPAIPIMGSDFHVSATSLSWVMSSMILTTVMFSVPLGKVADLFGKRKMLIAGLFLFFISSVLCVITPSYPFLIAARVLQGLSGAMTGATCVAILIDTYPANMRGRVLGINVACVYTGLSVGPVIGGLIVHFFNWRVVFALIAAIALASFIIAVAKLPKKRHGAQAAEQHTQSKINPVSLLLFITSMFAIMYGFTTFGQNILSYVLLGIGIMLLVLFGFHELHASDPLIEVRLFKNNPSFTLANLAAFCNYAATGALSYILAIHFQEVLGHTPNISGLLLIAQPLVMAVISPYMGKLSDRRSPSALASIGMALCAASMLSFIFVDETTSLVYFITSLIVAGIGFGMFSSPNNNAVMSSVMGKDYAVASSILNSMRGLGQMSSMAVITIVMNFTFGKTSLEQATDAQLVSYMHISFIIFAIVCLVGVALSLGRSGNTRNTGGKGETGDTER